MKRINGKYILIINFSLIDIYNKKDRFENMQLAINSHLASYLLLKILYKQKKKIIYL